MNYISLIEEYIENGINAIPVNNKVPLVKDWSRFSNEEIEDNDLRYWSQYKNVTGIGIVLGKSSNICCIDIDQEEGPLLDELKTQLQKSPYVKRGAKGETRFFRLPSNKEILKNKEIFKNEKGDVAVEFFFSGAQTVIPPSKHPDGMSFEWIGELKGVIDVEMLPEFDYDWNIRTAREIIDNVAGPIKVTGIIDKVTGTQRYNTFKDLIGKELNKFTPFDEIVRKCVLLDQTEYLNNTFLMASDKGLKKTEDIYMNAAYYVLDMMKSIYQQRKQRGDTPYEGSIFFQDNAREIQFGDIVKKNVPDLEKLKTKKEHLDIENVPYNIRGYIESISNNLLVDIDLVFSSLLTAFSAVIGNKAKIYPKTNDKSWHEPASLYTMIVAPSGSNKSAIEKIGMRYIDKIEKEEKDKKKLEFSKNKQLNRVLDVKINRLEKELKEASDKEITGILQEIDKLNKEKADLNMDYSIQINTATPEAIIQKVTKAKGKTLFWVEKELSDLARRFQKVGYEQLRKLLLTGHAGNESYRYLTKKDGEQNIDKLSFSFISFSQNDVIDSIIRSILAYDDGLLARCLIFKMNDKNFEPTDIKFDPFDNKIYSIFRKAYDAPPIEVHLTKEAYDYFMFTWNQLEQQRQGTAIGNIKSFYSKARGQVVRIAFLLQTIENDGIMSSRLEKKYIVNAVDILNLALFNTEYLITKNHKVDDYYEAIRSIKNMFKIVDGKRIYMSYDEFMKYSGLNKSRKGKKVFNDLMENNIIQEIGGAIHVNEKIYEEKE